MIIVGGSNRVGACLSFVLAHGLAHLITSCDPCRSCLSWNCPCCPWPSPLLLDVRFRDRACCVHGGGCGACSSVPSPCDATFESRRTEGITLLMSSNQIKGW